MDTKLRNKLKNNKYVLGIVMIILVYLLSFSLLLVSDIYKNRNFLNSQPYFNSDQFKAEINVFSNNLESFYIEYKDWYKISNSDIDAQVNNELSQNERYITNKQEETTDEYYNLIKDAQNRKDFDYAKQLTDELIKKIEDIRKVNSKTADEIKNNLYTNRNNDYINIKNSLKNNKNIKYYIRDNKVNEVYTNIDVPFSNINNYIKNNALYSIHFPEALNKSDFYSETSSFFNNRTLDSYIIIPNDIDKNSYIYKDYKYYNSVRTRIIKELVILFLVLSIIISSCLYLSYNKKNLYDIIPMKKMFSLVNKIPIDLRRVIFVILVLIGFVYIYSLHFFYMPLNIKHFFILTLVSIIIVFPILNLVNTFVIAKNKAKSKEEIKANIINCFLSIIKYSLKYNKNLIKLIIIFITTVGVGLYMDRFIEFYPLFICYIIYVLIVPLYVLRTFFDFCRIAYGTDKITNGNLNYEIKISGEGIMAKLANNINNMKLGFKKAVEDQVKSERLKSELMTNVSHDLKTPLTSIINYVDLLKRDDSTEEERKSYLSILDKKSQRLKVLIEDLFEASKVSSGNIEMNIEKIDVTSLLKQALGELNHKIEESNLTFKINIPNEKMYSNLDGKRTWRVFDNLINNALKYSQLNTRVYIDLQDENENIVFTIKNIASYELDFNAEEIFERFKRGDSSRSTEGSGLGLAIAKSIVELEQGSIDINIDGDLFKVIVKFKKVREN